MPQRSEQKQQDRAINRPSLIDDGNIKRCSVCKFPFHPDVKPTLTVAFTEHLAKAHKPGQASEDVNQAAASIVREATRE